MSKKKYRYWTRYKRTKSEMDLNQYKHLRNELRDYSRKISYEYEKNIADNIKKNPKAFWQYAKSKTNTTTSLTRGLAWKPHSHNIAK